MEKVEKDETALFWPSRRPLWQTSFSPLLPCENQSSKNGSYSFHQENTELSLAKITLSLQSKSVAMRSILVFSFCFRDSFQLQSLPIQVFHAATPVAHWNRQNVVQLWRRQSSLHRVRLSHILHYFLNPSRWKIMEWFVRYAPHKIQRRKDDWGRCQVMENVLSDQPH